VTSWVHFAKLFAECKENEKISHIFYPLQKVTENKNVKINSLAKFVPKKSNQNDERQSIALSVMWLSQILSLSQIEYYDTGENHSTDKVYSRLTRVCHKFKSRLTNICSNKSTIRLTQAWHNKSIRRLKRRGSWETPYSNNKSINGLTLYLRKVHGWIWALVGHITDKVHQ